MISQKTHTKPLETSEPASREKARRLPGKIGSKTDYTDGCPPLSVPDQPTGTISQAPVSQDKNRDFRHLFEKLVSDISARFVYISPEQVHGEIHSALAGIRYFFAVDRCALLQIDHDRDQWQISHFDFQPGLIEIPVNETLPREMFPWVYEQLVKKNSDIVFSSTDQLPEEADADKANYQKWGIQSVLAIPVAVDGTTDYNMVITADRRAFEWPEIHIPRLRLLGEVLIKSLMLAQSQLFLAAQQRFEHLISDISTGFLLTASKNTDKHLHACFEKITAFVDADQCVLTLFSPGFSDIAVDHGYTRPGISLKSGDLWKAPLPWFMSQLVNGEAVLVSHFQDLPDNANHERRFFLDNHIQSIVCVRVTIDAETFGVFSVICLKAARIWAEEMIKRITLMAELLITGIARNHMSDQLRKRMHEVEMLKNRIETENMHLKKESLQREPTEMIAKSQTMKNILYQLEQVATIDTTVLIVGETGVGKEVMARTLHRLSHRKDRPLVTVNCASLPPTLIESELFGREKGAYTGALTRMMGRFELADNATLFLDEIGELPAEIQSKLLRVIEQGRFERLGSSKPLQVNVRLIAATNRNLEQEVAEGHFRKDLYYRLNVFPIRIPPLRERTEDIPPLVWLFIREFEKKMGKRIDHVTDPCMKTLMNFDWPGNARELRNMVEHAMILANSRTLSVLPSLKRLPDVTPRKMRMNDVERNHILEILLERGWRISGKDGAATALGMKRSTLQSRMKKLGIQRPTRTEKTWPP